MNFELQPGAAGSCAPLNVTSTMDEQMVSTHDNLQESFNNSESLSCAPLALCRHDQKEVVWQLTS